MEILIYYFNLIFIAELTVGNVLPVGAMPEGTVVCQLEEKHGDRGKLARTSGNLKFYYFNMIEFV
jgi:ribosomal protein L2